MNNNKDLISDIMALEEFMSKHQIDSYIILAVSDMDNYLYLRGLGKRISDLLLLNEYHSDGFRDAVTQALDKAYDSATRVEVQDSIPVITKNKLQ